MIEPRQFTCFDDHDNDGWGNSTIDREQVEPVDEEEKIPLENYTLDDEENLVRVAAKDVIISRCNPTRTNIFLK